MKGYELMDDRNLNEKLRTEWLVPKTREIFDRESSCS